MQHRDKYAPLAEWLRQQPGEPFQMTFGEIEELLGEPLPRSSHLYAGHWYSHAGSRPGRAIHDAGFGVRELDLVESRVVLERRDAGTEAALRGEPTSSLRLAAPLPAEDAAQERGAIPDLLRE